jgi:hypothetical protein
MNSALHEETKPVLLTLLREELMKTIRIVHSGRSANDRTHTVTIAPSAESLRSNTEAIEFPAIDGL